MSSDFGFEDEDKTKKIENQHYDEAVELTDQASEIMSGEDEDGQQQQQQMPGGGGAVQQQKANQQAGPINYPAEDKVAKIQGAYNPADYFNLNVTSEVKELFKYIDRYKPPTMELEAKLRPFIPEYIPAIGEVDAFLKMPRPDAKQETLGLVTLDEPALNQSKKAKLDLMMREYKKVANRGNQITVHTIENADKNPKEITAWINDVAEIHKKKQPPSVSYSKAMPDIDTLMQVWPQEMEDFLNECQLPNENIDLPLNKYCQLVCNLMDIPVHNTNNNKNLIESLHVLFTLYCEFKENQHFQQQDDQKQQQEF